MSKNKTKITPILPPENLEDSGGTYVDIDSYLAEQTGTDPHLQKLKQQEQQSARERLQKRKTAANKHIHNVSNNQDDTISFVPAFDDSKSSLFLSGNQDQSVNGKKKRKIDDPPVADPEKKEKHRSKTVLCVCFLFFCIVSFAGKNFNFFTFFRGSFSITNFNFFIPRICRYKYLF